MATEGVRHFRVKEDPVIVERYNTIKQIGQEMFAATHVAEVGIVTSTDIDVAYEFLAEAAKQVHPVVYRSYWEHVLIAPELGKRVAQQAAASGFEGVDAKEIEFLLYLHDLGRLPDPRQYFRNDTWTDRLLSDFGIPKHLKDELPSLKRLMDTSVSLGLSEAQLSFAEPLSDEQMEIATVYFDSQSPTERIINLCDNLGKRDKNGLFTLAALGRYLREQEARYEPNEQKRKGGPKGWGTVEFATDQEWQRRRAGAVLQLETVKRTVEWLESDGVDPDLIGVDVHEILEELKDFGPRFMIIARHGDIDNPTGIVYNRDQMRNPMTGEEVQNVIHLNENGVNQMEALGRFLQQQQYVPVRVITSPQTRAQESARFLSKGLGREDDILVLEDINEANCSGPFFERVTMDDWKKQYLGVLSVEQQVAYEHETPEEIRERVLGAFTEEVARLGAGEVSVFVSHGDPVALLVNQLAEGNLPDQDDLRHKMYPQKGTAVLAVIQPNGELFTLYPLEDPSLKKGSLY